MIVLVEANVLTVGLSGKSEVLRELPIQVINMQSGYLAARSLKTEKIDSVISNWNLGDMKGGQFIRNLKKVKPKIPTIVFIQNGNRRQEIEARSLGVSAVLTDDSSDELFRETVANVLGIEMISIKSISPAKRVKNAVQSHEIHK